jgi:hypothetical protein
MYGAADAGASDECNAFVESKVCRVVHRGFLKRKMVALYYRR